MARIQWTKRANDALTAIIVDRRQQVGFVAARALRQRITDRVHLLRDFPEIGRRRDERDKGRELIVSPYIIPYQLVDDGVLILDVFHARSSFSDDDGDTSES